MLFDMIRGPLQQGVSGKRQHQSFESREPRQRSGQKKMRKRAFPRRILPTTISGLPRLSTTRQHSLLQRLEQLSCQLTGSPML
jgi:hypothetical protein